MHEKTILEKLFDRGGYVLNFNDRTFAEFFRENKINIDADKYRFNGNSKMKRLRAFWEIESDTTTGNILNALLNYACATENVSETDKSKALAVINRLLNKNSNEKTEEDFLKTTYSSLNISKLNLDITLQTIIEQRIEEIHKTLESKASLATIFLCGSTLEGILLDIAGKNIQQFNSTKIAPKNKEGKVKLLPEWTLDNLINTAHELNFLSLDIKKYGHTLRDFRNYIHPRQQAVQGFNPDHHTAKISWQVLQAVIANLCGER